MAEPTSYVGFPDRRAALLDLGKRTTLGQDLAAPRSRAILRDLVEASAPRTTLEVVSVSSMGEPL